MERFQRLLFVFCALVATNAAHAESPFKCGEFNPSTFLSPSADLGLIATSRLGSPGQPYLPNSFQEAGWFLIDSFGTGALMGCSPATSTIQGWSQTNSYNDDGTLKTVTAKRFGVDDPVTLRFEYENTLPYRLSAADNFCMSIGAEQVHYTFVYQQGRLKSMTQQPDVGCPSEATVTISYDYGDSKLPGLPTKMVVSQDNKADETSTYTYALQDGRIQSITVTDSNSSTYTIRLGYTNALVTSLTMAGTQFSLGYRNGSQWKTMIDPRYQWGLTIDYFTDNTVESTAQTTGCPGCPANYFTY